MKNLIIEGYTVMIDDEDYERVTAFHWSLEKKPEHLAQGRYYFRMFIRNGNKIGERVYLHRFILGLKKGDGLFGDHISNNTLDCRRSNLRKCTPGQSVMNRRSLRSTTGRKGVVFHKASGKYQAQIGYHGRMIYLGTFVDPKEAQYRYLEAVRKYHGDFANIKTR
jgi:hypothetical protein